MKVYLRAKKNSQKNYPNPNICLKQFLRTIYEENCVEI